MIEVCVLRSRKRGKKKKKNGGNAGQNMAPYVEWVGL